MEKKYYCQIALFVGILLHCSTTLLYAQYNTDNLQLCAEEQAKRYYSYKNLCLYPIYGNEEFKSVHENVGNYMVLKEAMQSDKVRISELQNMAAYDPTNNVGSPRESVSLPIEASSSATTTQSQNQSQNSSEPNDVSPIPVEIPGSIPQEQEQAVTGSLAMFNNNVLHPELIANMEAATRLFITNQSNDTIYLMAGEVIKGGKQDRVLAKDMVIPPYADASEIPVFCVEKGRWGYKNDAYEEFNEYFAVSSMKVREAVQTKATQGDVWREVDLVNVKNEIKTTTNSYAALGNSAQFRAELQTYISYFETSFIGNKEIVGVVVLTGDKVVGCDIFATNDLFLKQYPNLLTAYATEAMTNGSKVNVPEEKVQEYINSFLLKEGEQEEQLKGKGALFKVGDRKLHISTF